MTLHSYCKDNFLVGLFGLWLELRFEETFTSLFNAGVILWHALLSGFVAAIMAQVVTIFANSGLRGRFIFHSFGNTVQEPTD